ncbi:unnamed protein product [Rotaria sp. Silwood1]|nr:unnamed protein product [Rotaria sp. Silwood1]CAF1095916.1 unnamed protein product [Rotaria sp. Silwood1]CAF3418373.1 unnamed protein product [Rotaria sp. Silwood1]CAF3442930.1 unnamed protein product [Rotaria sp. Silwood1]CAF4618150.1 unnamed protein product [Rotaria sp. Silwood1]
MLLICACFGFFFAITPAIPFMLLNRRIYFRWCSFAFGYFLLMLTCLMEDLLNIRIVITGDDLINDKKRSLIILNHRTRLDWMFIWMCHSRYEILNQLKIVLKAQLKHIPCFGWSCQHAGYLFLERVWTQDQQTMKSMMSYYKSCQAPISVRILKEFFDSQKDKIRNIFNLYRISIPHTYAYDNNETPYDYCLHPRTTGFTYLLNTMRSDDIIDNVDDVTIGYEGNFPVTEFDLLKGVIPKVIHFHVKRFSINDLPQEDEKINQWLQNCWNEKENRLKEFYTKNQFDSTSKRFNNQQIESHVRFQRRLSLILWILFILFWSYCLIAYIKIKLYVLLVCLFHVVIESFANGIIDFVFQLDENYRQKQRAIKQD